MEKEKAEKVKNLKNKALSRKGISLLTQIAVIILVFFLYIIADYISFGGTMDFITDWGYWVSITISMILVVSVMIVVRSMRKAKQIAVNKSIGDNLETVDAVRRVVLANGYGDLLQEHIDKVNEDAKVDAYFTKITKKLNRLQNLPLRQEKKDKLLRKYEKQLELSREEILKQHIKYTKISQTGLFAGVDGKIATYNKYDIQTHNSKDVAQMVSVKAFVFYLLTAFSGTMIIDFMWNGWSAIWGTALKLFSLAMATFSATNQADNFVNYNVEQALNNRVQIILDFVNKHEDVRQKVLEKKQKKESEI